MCFCGGGWVGCFCFGVWFGFVGFGLFGFFFFLGFFLFALGLFGFCFLVVNLGKNCLLDLRGFEIYCHLMVKVVGYL